jgi:hypothetical protein
MQVALFSTAAWRTLFEEQRGAAPTIPAAMSNEPSITLIPPEVEAVPAEYRAGVAVQLAALRAQARLVEEFPLPDELEPAPVFTP